MLLRHDGCRRHCHFRWWERMQQYEINRSIIGKLVIPDTQIYFFFKWQRIRFPHRSPDSGSFWIRPGDSPFNTAIRTLCALGAQIRFKSGRTRLTTNLSVPRTFHHFIGFQIANSLYYMGLKCYLFLFYGLVIFVHIDERYWSLF